MKGSRASLNAPERKKNVAPIILLALGLVFAYALITFLLHIRDIRVVLGR